MFEFTFDLFLSPAVCEELVNDPDVAEFYEPVPVHGVITCVTICNSLHSRPKTCYNKGTCRVYRDMGPLCECRAVNSTWYLGNDCRFPIQRTAFYAGLSVTLAFLLVTVGALTAHVLINNHKQTQRRDIKEKLVNQWFNEDFKWSRSNSPLDAYNAGGYRNPSFPHKDSASHRKDPGDYRRPVDNRLSSSSASMFPSLQTAHRHDTPRSNGSVALPLRDLSSNLPMRISRPRIRTSWDA
ncbi:mucin-2-like isoform X1 [Lates japonicus]